MPRGLPEGHDNARRELQALSSDARYDADELWPLVVAHDEGTAVAIAARDVDAHLPVTGGW
jgi:hypothetical protein